MNALQEHSIVASFFESGEQTFTDNPTLHEFAVTSIIPHLGTRD